VRREKQMVDRKRRVKEANPEILRFNTDEIINDIATQKVETISRASAIQLSIEDQRAIVLALVPAIRLIVSPAPLVATSAKAKQVESRQNGR